MNEDHRKAIEEAFDAMPSGTWFTTYTLRASIPNGSSIRASTVMAVLGKHKAQITSHTTQQALELGCPPEIANDPGYTHRKV
jgi:hypothetical protein